MDVQSDAPRASEAKTAGRANKMQQRRAPQERTPTCCKKRPPSSCTRKKNLTPAHWRSLPVVLIVVLQLSLYQDNWLLSRVAAIEETPPQPGSSIKRQQVAFVEPANGENNVQKVAVGRPVSFKCVVSNIGEHKIAWFHKDRHILLAVDNKTVAWRERIQVSSQANSVFTLTIESVHLSDKGQYICQLNTQPARSQTHILEVVKPPQIREQETTVNLEPVREFSPVELRCVADGIPRPTIKWRRESRAFELPASLDETLPAERSKEIQSETASHNEHQPPSRTGGDESKPFIAEGEILRIDRVSRYDMGYYECIASNGVPPRVSQRIFLPVSYVAPARVANQTNSTTHKNNTQAPGRTGGGGRSRLGLSASTAERTPNTTTSLEPNWVASGRGHQRQRPLKATRSSAVSSSAAPSTCARACPMALLPTLALLLTTIMGRQQVEHVRRECLRRR